MKLSILCLISLTLFSKVKLEEIKDYYKLLGIPRDATGKEIRKAFKSLALKLHPDKNKESADAEEKFVKVAHAYEILKDPISRKQYDLDGEDWKEKRQNYHSYSYYRDHFGIYDDDPLILTLSKDDYDVNVLDPNQAWFVNFYSPHCHHCHDLAPVWRKLAEELEGIIRVAAVNCEEDYVLCYQLSIEAYPSLLFYEKETHYFDPERYRGSKTLEALKQYALSKVSVDIKSITSENWQEMKMQQLLLLICEKESSDCLETEEIKKIAATLEGLLPVGVITDIDFGKNILNTNETHPIVFWQLDDKKIPKTHIIRGADRKEILDTILNILPHPPTLNEKQFHDLRTKLRLGFDKPWLICFYLGTATDLKLELKRLPTIIPNINIGLIHCGKSSSLCSALHIVRYPTWGVIKSGGAFELHQGRDALHEVAAFARDSAKSTNLHALSPADFHNIKRDSSPWFIDWFAPWCPPCKKLTPELRKASQHFTSDVVQFGTIDCTLHRQLCSEERISSYPSMVLYNGSVIHKFHGAPTESAIVAFIQDAMNPVVLELDDSNFSRLTRKSAKELWIVDFFAPWCRACQLMETEYKNFAKSMKQFSEVIIAKVDCEANGDICSGQHITAYPTIRLYPLGSKGLSTVAIYNGHRTTLALKQWVLSMLPSRVEVLDEQGFRDQILSKKYYLPWLVDFYAPWCGHCVHFEPDFRLVARRLDGKVRSAKIDCEANRVFCGHQRVSAYPTVRLYLSPDNYVNLESKNPTDISNKVKEILQDSKQNEIHDEL
ncbi:dnaJ homolog subfamily C member 10-like [Rhynchophorus ferrugineus]|uniref:dnaJ homolog subfamily C member 10-like n=1 Tax=Rhynchophorus ferrugineus TaxID=354439 RepID=UPI003FCE75B2